MNIKRNVAISMLGQVFSVASRLIVVPIYLKLLGIEAYGLVGLFMLFTAMLQLVNFGIGSTTLREMSRMKGGAAGSSAVRAQLRRSVMILSAVAFAFAAAVAVFAPTIGSHWLHVSSLPLRDVSLSLRLMAVAAALTFVTNIFRNGLYGMEKQVSVNLLGILIGALRSFGVIPVLMFVSSSPVPFCIYQLGVSLLELFLMQQTLYRALPLRDGSTRADAARGGEFWRFAGGIAFTDLVWAAAMQVDRIVLSTALPLAKYGYFLIVYNAAFTFRIANGEDTKRIWSQMRDTMRRAIRRAEEKLSVQPLDVSGFVDFYFRNLAQRRRRPQFTREECHRILSAAMANDAVEMHAAVGTDGQLWASVATVYDNHSMYYLLTTQSDAAKDGGSVALLIWRAIKSAVDKGLAFDFDGFGDSGSAVFLSQFGGTLCPRLRVSKMPKMLQSLLHLGPRYKFPARN